MGGAFIGLADDGSAVFWNPAGLTQIERPTFYLFETNLIPQGTYKLDAYQIDAKTKSKVYPSGAAAYLRPVGEKLVLAQSRTAVPRLEREIADLHGQEFGANSVEARRAD